jgi:hypothetical protein
VSAHIFAGCPSVQKSPGNTESQDVSVKDVQVVFFVTTPCLHEPHFGPGATTQLSSRLRPDPSMVEMARQKSPRIGFAHVELTEQELPPLSLQKPLVVGTSTLQASGSVAALDPHAYACVLAAVSVAV